MLQLRAIKENNRKICQEYKFCCFSAVGNLPDRTLREIYADEELLMFYFEKENHEN